MPLWIWVGLGGFIGAILRYAVNLFLNNSNTAFPFGTLTVNFVGSFLLGLFYWIASYRMTIADEPRLFLTVGLIGAFTTMSTFGYESIRLLEEKQHLLFGLNILGNVGLSLCAILLSRSLAGALTQS